MYLYELRERFEGREPTWMGRMKAVYDDRSLADLAALEHPIFRWIKAK
jgi:hypothetical protein